ncbi:hypothetical protein [Amnibacterium endophyticum]|uniref:Uncharacterized protein n=1 Tax=Amnibacterium endophyticum TaxID=2109337 RepID=A0ABW4LDH3_9MICO
MTTNPDQSAVPSTVRTASLLYLAHGVLRLISALLSLILLPQTIDLARRTASRQLQGQDTSGVDLDAVATGSAVVATAFAVLAGVVIGVLTIVFARKLLVGRNWARITLLVFAVLALPGLLALGGVGGIGVGLLSAVSSLAAVAGAVLSFLPSSNPWFRRSTAPRPEA